jgi:post-segregation antitoxin (ccd killing protein)
LQLEEVKRLLEDEVTRLRKKLKAVTTEKNELDYKNKSLGLNISLLYKTAIAEIQRKDTMIAELREE